MKLESFLNEHLISSGTDQIVRSAVNGDAVAYAHNVAGKNLRRLTFHQRADLLKLAQYLTERAAFIIRRRAFNEVAIATKSEKSAWNLTRMNKGR